MTVLSMTLLNRTSAALKIYCRTVLHEMRATSDVDDMRGPAIEEWLVALVAPGAADFSSPKPRTATKQSFYACAGLDSGPVDTHKNAHTKPVRMDAVCGETRTWITEHIYLMSTNI
jgi:hypothetical protein